MSSPAHAPESHADTGARARLNADPTRWGVAAIAEIGMAVALAAVLGQVRLFVMPQGGSVSLELLPLVFVAVRRGVIPGVATGLLYGLLQLGLPGAFVLHPAQALLDYPLAFMGVGLAGLVRVGPLDGARGALQLLAAVAVAGAARLVFHFLSGLVFFAEYAPHWEAPWLYALTYNLLYLVPEVLLSAALLWPVLRAYDAAYPARAGRAL
jgi:thiamine transporter